MPAGHQEAGRPGGWRPRRAGAGHMERIDPSNLIWSGSPGAGGFNALEIPLPPFSASAGLAAGCWGWRSTAPLGPLFSLWAIYAGATPRSPQTWLRSRPACWYVCAGGSPAHPRAAPAGCGCCLTGLFSLSLAAPCGCAEITLRLAPGPTPDLVTLV
jgi:hypothetical protein